MPIRRMKHMYGKMSISNKISICEPAKSVFNIPSRVNNFDNQLKIKPITKENDILDFFKKKIVPPKQSLKPKFRTVSFLIDISSSMTLSFGELSCINAVKNKIIKLSAQLQKKDFMNISTFHNEYDKICSATINEISEEKINRISANGTTTHLYDSLYKFLNDITMTMDKHYVIVLTDGDDNGSSEDSIDALKEKIATIKKEYTETKIIFITIHSHSAIKLFCKKNGLECYVITDEILFDKYMAQITKELTIIKS